MANASTRSRTVVSSPEKVWGILADFDRIVDWASTVNHSEAMSERPFGVGSARRAQVGRLTLVETVIDWSPNERLAYTLEGLPPFVDRAVNTWVLEPAGTDRTTITLTADVTPGPKPPMKLAAAVLTKVIQRGNDKLLDGLVKHLSAGDAAARSRAARAIDPDTEGGNREA